ncbi:MAG: nucleotide sugar dehydrogenase [Vicinamibacterales bacterium]
MSTLLDRIQARQATVGIIGQGYVGLPLALVFHEAGFPVWGFDVDPRKVEALSRGASYIKHIGADRVAAAISRGNFSATTDFDRLADCDAIIICVPTPLGKHREPDLSYITETARAIARRLRRGQLIVLESTTYPGTTDEDVRPILEGGGLRCPEDFLLAFSPEREDPGNQRFSTKTIPKVVGGVNPPSTDAAVALYAAAIDRVVAVSSARVAESCKLVENVYRSVNIALVNELKVTFDRMGIDVWEVIEAAKTKPFGFTPFYPGPGLGGHCIPLDPFYLSWKASEHGMWTRFIELAGEINTSMPRYVFQKVVSALNDDAKSVKGSRVCVLGLSYKENIDDDRESPSYEIIELLQEAGAVVDYCDPFFPVARAGRKHDIGLTSVPCTADALSRYDALVVSTAHERFRDPALYKGVSLVVDTRNIVRPAPGGPEKVVKA